VAAVLVLLAAQPQALAQARPAASAPAPAPVVTPAPSPTPAPTSAQPTGVEVRLSLSKAAADAFSERRFRNKLAIELQSIGTLASGTGGPIGDDVALVWVDVPRAGQALIHVRAGPSPVARRAIDLGGLASDVAGRVVAIAIVEMLLSPGASRASARPRRLPPPRAPTPEQLEAALRAQPALVWTGGAAGAWLPGAGALLAGASAGLALRAEQASEQLTARWLGGRGDAGTLGWLEVGVGLDYRIWVANGTRLALGAAAAASAVHLGGARAVDGIAGQHDSWSARAGARLGLEARLGPSAWLGLTLEPGAILRPVPYETPAAGAATVSGPFLGVALELAIERRLARP
jgi:hypothetical protein